jgi:hypothetical protein
LIHELPLRRRPRPGTHWRAHAGATPRSMLNCKYHRDPARGRATLEGRLLRNGARVVAPGERVTGRE